MPLIRDLEPHRHQILSFEPIETGSSSPTRFFPLLFVDESNGGLVSQQLRSRPARLRHLGLTSVELVESPPTLAADLWSRAASHASPLAELAQLRQIASWYFCQRADARAIAVARSVRESGTGPLENHSNPTPCRLEIVLREAASVSALVVRLDGQQSNSLAGTAELCASGLEQLLELSSERMVTGCSDSGIRQLSTQLLRGDACMVESAALPEQLASLWQNEHNVAFKQIGDPVNPSRFTQAGEEQLNIVAGAFQPLHAGHQQMFAVSDRRNGATRTWYELSLANADKPQLDAYEVLARMRQFNGNLILTNASAFVDKAKLFPGSVFAVGIDTMIRVADPSYYQGDSRLRDQAVARISESGCRFLVFGRIDRQNRFATLRQIKLPKTLAAICDEVPEQEMRVDVSSTQLRAAVRRSG